MRRGYGRSRTPPDLIEQARENLGHGADAATIADALFDASFRALKQVPPDHPSRWAIVVGYWEKLAALYESMSDGSVAGDGLIIAKYPRADAGGGPGKQPGMHNKPGLATPESPKHP